MVLQSLFWFVLTIFNMTTARIAAVISPLLYRWRGSIKSQTITELGQVEQVEFASRGIIHIYGSLYVAMLDAEQAERLAQHILGKYFFIQLNTRQSKSEISSFVPSSLTEVFRFDEMLRTAQRQNPFLKIILCTDSDSYVQAKTMFLLVCHLIMTQAFAHDQLAETYNHLEHILRCSESEIRTFQNCCMAVHRAKGLGWIDFKDVFDVSPINENRIFIEEYIHYARQVTDACVLSHTISFQLSFCHTWVAADCN